jgi:hypothetical protein
MGMAEEAASRRSRLQAPRPRPTEPQANESRLWSAIKKKYRAREDRLNAEGLLTWDAVDNVNHPGFHAPSGFCEPAGWLASN